MHWFGGSIAEAVTLSKQKNTIFVVFVEDDNEQSIEMASTIDHESIVVRLGNQENFLAVKLKSGSVDYTHFAQIYQFVPVPSLFFIGRNGTPLEVVCAGVQADNLALRIDRILTEHNKDKPPTMQPSTSSQSIRDQTTSLLQSEAASAVPVATQKVDRAPPTSDSIPPKADAVSTVDSVPEKVENSHQKQEPEPSAPPAKIQKTSPSQDYEVVCEGDVCVRRPRGEPGASTSGQGAVPPARTSEPKPIPAQESASDVSEADKMKRAKELIEARRREKIDKEKELEKQKELDRRSQGQGVAELKKWQADQELKNLQEERRREKMENDLARKRILDQIAQDRAERKARDTQAPATEPAPAQHTSAPPPTSGDSQSTARIQFKLPDGSSHSASFSSADTLQVVQRYVADNLQLSTSNFALWTAFPRQELVATDSTLRELQLAPSAALLVLPRHGTSQPSQSSASFSVFSFISQLLASLIYEPTAQLYTWLRSRLFPPPAVAPRGTSNSPAPTRRTPASTTRLRGNIHRLPGDAPDDDNNTWNGNSTQQM